HLPSFKGGEMQYGGWEMAERQHHAPEPPSPTPLPPPAQTSARGRGLLPPERVARLTGYGFTTAADSYLYRPTSLDEIREILRTAREAGRQVTLRGAGRSYGDANVGAECILIDTSRMRQILSWDPATGLIDCESGVTIEDLWRHVLEDGYWPPVVSGTMFPTLGGALAMNIHGKNNFCAGTLGEHVVEMDVLTANGEILTLTPRDDLFYAVISGFGSLGIIARVKLQMKRVQSGDLTIMPISAANWDEQFRALEEFESNADYMVSWVDCFGRGSRSGRGLFHAAWYQPSAISHQPSSFDSTLRPEHQDLPDTIMGLFPKSMVWRFLKKLCNRPGMHLLNWAKYRSSKMLGNGRPHTESLVGFSFLLDYVPNWRNAYLPHGFIQYQSFVPKEKAREVFAKQVQLQQKARLESFLGVMKRHRPDKFLFSHAVDGYSLALDFKVTRRNRHRLLNLCYEMNELVHNAGGRFYFAKDSTLRPSDVKAFMGFEALAKYREIKAKLDPDGLFTSELARRLEL
ncbi:MAG: FAD-dependent oxidoreductase, partial [Fimbriimonadales bacterium]